MNKEREKEIELIVSKTVDKKKVKNKEEEM